MTSSIPRLVEISDLNPGQLKQVFLRSSFFKKHLQNNGTLPSELKLPCPPKVFALVFLEPSSRTRFSFEMALHRLGQKSICLDSLETSSLSKGESAIDTLETILAMKPDGLILRYKNDPQVEARVKSLEIPVVSAGQGKLHHPTQALLDAFTLMERLSSLEGKKLLFLGDLAHSRVAHSNIELLQSLGMELRYCSPEGFGVEGITGFDSIEEGLSWCDVVMGLRVQTERHDSQFQLDKQSYVKNYQLNKDRLSLLGPEAIIMHPGPTNWGVEFSEEVLQDPRQVIREQVENGVYVRAAILSMLLQTEVKL